MKFFQGMVREKERNTLWDGGERVMGKWGLGNSDFLPIKKKGTGKKI